MCVVVVRSSVRLDPAPACILDNRGDLVTWNRSFRNFALPVGLLAATPPNLVAWVFSDAYAPDVVEDWDSLADDAAAWLYTLSGGDPGVDALLAELSHTAGKAFRRRWHAHPVGSHTPIPRIWRHPDMGRVALHLEAFAISGSPRLHLAVLEPADDDAERAIARLEDLL